MALTRRSLRLPVVLSATLMGIMGVALLGPVLPTLKGTFEVSDAQVGLVLTAYTTPGIVIAPFVGLVSDRIGRRRVLVPLLFLYGVAGGGIVLVESFEQLLVLRFLQGIGASSLIALAVTLLGDYYTGRRRGKVVSLNSSVIGIGAAIFPGLGGLLVILHWAAPFAFFGVAVLVAVLALAVLDEPDVDRELSLSAYVARFETAVRSRRVLGMYGAALATYVMFYGGVLTAMPLLLDGTYGLSAPVIGLLLASTSVASATLASQNVRLSDRASIETVLGTAFLTFGIAFVGIWWTDSVYVIGAMLLLFGVGVGLTMPSIDRTIVSTVPGAQRASVMGLLSTMIWLGQTIGPVVFPLLATDPRSPFEGYPVLYLTFGLAAICIGVITQLRYR